jgi:hypothetical protein
VLLVLVVAVIAAGVAQTMTDTTSSGRALTAGVWAGAVMSLVVFLWGMGMAVASPERLALDPSVVARYSGSELIAANLGETAVPYILGLIGGPLIGAFSATLGIAVSGVSASWRRHENASGQ